MTRRGLVIGEGYQGSEWMFEMEEDDGGVDGGRISEKQRFDEIKESQMENGRVEQTFRTVRISVVPARLLRLSALCLMVRSWVSNSVYARDDSHYTSKNKISKHSY